MEKVSEPDPDYCLTTKTRQKIEEKVPSRGEVCPNLIILRLKLKNDYEKCKNITHGNETNALNVRGQFPNDKFDDFYKKLRLADTNRSI